MNPGRALAALGAVLLALVLQVSLFSHLSWAGVVPNLCLLVVVGAGLVRGTEFAMVLGVVAGVLVDLAPPADHVVGRWALALLAVGYVAGRVRSDVRPTATSVVAAVAACSFVGSSVFAISGVLLGDLGLGVGDLLEVIVVALIWDVLLTPFVLPPVMAMFRAFESDRVPA